MLLFFVNIFFITTLFPFIGRTRQLFISGQVSVAVMCYGKSWISLLGLYSLFCS